MKTFKITKVTPFNTVSNGTLYSYIIKRETISADAFGATSSETYQIVGTKSIALGTEVPIDIATYDVVEKPFTFSDEKTGEDVTINIKRLYPKRD